MSTARTPTLALAALVLLTAAAEAQRVRVSPMSTPVSSTIQAAEDLALEAAVLPVAPPSRAVVRQVEDDEACEDTRSFSDWFWVAGLGSEVRSDISTSTGQERALLGGVIVPFGCGGQYMVRTDLATGFRSTPSSIFASLFGGLQLSLARTFSQPFIELTPTTRVEPYVLAGGGTYIARDLPEAPDQSAWVPNVTTGFGLRLAAMESVIGLTLVEVVREQRFGQFNPRWYFRFGLAW